MADRRRPRLDWRRCSLRRRRCPHRHSKSRPRGRDLFFAHAHARHPRSPSSRLRTATLAFSLTNMFLWTIVTPGPSVETVLGASVACTHGNAADRRRRHFANTPISLVARKASTTPPGQMTSFCFPILSLDFIKNWGKKEQIGGSWLARERVIWRRNALRIGRTSARHRGRKKYSACPATSPRGRSGQIGSKHGPWLGWFENQVSWGA